MSEGAQSPEGSCQVVRTVMGLALAEPETPSAGLTDGRRH